MKHEKVIRQLRERERAEQRRQDILARKTVMESEREHSFLELEKEIAGSSKEAGGVAKS